VRSMRTSDKARPRREVWRELIRPQEASGLTVRAFCRERGLQENAFYLWRKRLAENEPARFALVETDAAAPARTVLELVLASGDRLQIAPGADVATLRTVLAGLRERA
jgi:hypothetical protein